MTRRSILSRLEWCRQQSMQAPTQSEREGWRAEEEGLRDALFHRNHSESYQNRSPCVFERYAIGLEDGRALNRLALTDRARGNQPPRGPMSDLLGSLGKG